MDRPTEQEEKREREQSIKINWVSYPLVHLGRRPHTEPHKCGAVKAHEEIDPLFLRRGHKDSGAVKASTGKREREAENTARNETFNLFLLCTKEKILLQFVPDGEICI